MVVGRVSRDLADRAGVARVKLAYIADSTSSAVACVAFVSTWIAFQLSMISEAFVLAGRPANPYAVFLESLPYNFYCWFTLVLLFVAIRWRFHPGPMADSWQQRPQVRAHAENRPTGKPRPSHGSRVSALVPLAVLHGRIFRGFRGPGQPAARSFP